MYTAAAKTDRDELLVQHAPLVRKLAYQMKAKLPANVEVDDLIQAGMIGLLDAASRYAEVQGARFDTYATQRIRGAMLDELRGADWAPRATRQNMRKVELAVAALQQRLGRAPLESEIAAELTLTLAEYQQLLADATGHQLAFYEDFQEDGDGDHFLDRFPGAGDPMECLSDRRFRSALVEAIEALPEREKVMMGLYYEQEMNLKEIGAVLGVTESRVCQMHSQAVARVRAALREKTWIGAA